MARVELVGWILAFIVAIGAVAWLVVDGRDEADSSNDADRSPPTAAINDDVATQTLRARNYDVGDCVDWDHDDRRAYPVIVDCYDDHEFEVAARVDVSDEGDEFPTASDWVNISTRYCDPAVAEYLGGAPDMSEGFFVGILHPLLEGWAEGERHVYCGIQTVRSDQKLTRPARAA